MLRPYATVYLCLLATITVSAQSPSGGAREPSVPAGETVIRTGTELVIVDVVAQDKEARPIHGLTREDFILSENKVTQNLRHFEEHTVDQPSVPGPPLPPQPAGVFTDYSPVAPNGVLNVLVLDSLNTPTKDQAYVRTELQEYVKKANPGTRIAIFGLTNRLFFLQGFTSDPKLLKEAVDHKLSPNASSLLADPTGSNSDIASSDDLVPAQLAANLQSFEAEQEAFKTRLRMQYTLDAFNQLGHYLAAFPGRKNLIWFSGSFPLDIVPDLTLANPFMVMGGDEEAEYHETTNLLTKAQVAVYPVDARGIMMDPGLDASHSGKGYSKNPQNFAADQTAFSGSQVEEHQTMQAIADDTGGQAFFNTNDLATAVAKAIDSGSNFYELAYSPNHQNANGEYRTIQVELANAAAAKRIRLDFRKGYFAEDITSPPNHSEHPTIKASTAEDRPAYSYAAAAMSRGAPMPSDIVFRVRVLPASTAVENSLAPDNQSNPKVGFKAPYRRYDIDISTPGENFAFMVQPNGVRTGGIAFLAYVFDSDGKMLNAVGKSVQLHQTSAEHQKFIESKVGYHLEVSAPASGESFIRIGVHDLTTDTFGVVEIPTSSVIHLPPPVYPSRKQ